MPLGFERLNVKKSQPNGHINFIKPLKGPDESIAQDFLERIAAQCLPVMKTNHIYVMALEEYPPNPEFVGRNFNAGEVIQLVLKSRSGRWLPFEYVQMVMMHELAHCKQMNHSKFFWEVRNQYAAQMRGLWARGYSGDGLWGRGALLGTGEWEKNTILPEEALPEHLCGGTYRSRRRKRKAKPTLSYQERKERRILKKFGANGITLGADDEVKAELEKGKRVQGKPRVAGSARGRELRAAAALARFEQQKKEKAEEEVRVKVKDEDETASDSETENDYDEDQDRDQQDALDLDGKRLVDHDGMGMIKVCDDENPNDDDAKREILELQKSLKTPRRLAKNGAGDDEAAKSHSQVSVAIKSEDETGRILKNIKQAKEDDGKEDEAAQRPVRREGSGSPPTTTMSTAEPATCPICCFANPNLAVTCTICSHVLDPESVTNSWRCGSSSCNPGYVNSGDCGVCGICGLRKPTLASA